MHRDNWDDLRFVLAVADHGSVSAAARALKVNHATVLRRIAAFEERHGSAIFDKTARGYSLPPNRADVIDAVREVESAILSVDRIIEGSQAPLQGVVRVTSTDSFCFSILPKLVADFRETASDLSIELLSSNQHLDLSRLDADVTVRPAANLPDELQGDVVGKLQFGVYQAEGAPDRWIGLSGALARSAPALWQAKAVPPELVAGASDSFVTSRELVARGLGRSILPCLLGDGDPRFRKVATTMPDISVDIWVASHADLAKVPRIQAVRQYLTERLTAFWRDPS